MTSKTHLGGKWWRCDDCGRALEAACDCCEPPTCGCHRTAVTEAAAALGRMGRGEAKRRGDSDHYRALAARRKTHGRQAVTDEQIRALRAEAGEAGDSAMVASCDRALSGSRSARARCIRAILDAQAAR